MVDDKQEIEKELKHNKELFNRLRQRLRELELTEATFGINAKPETRIEIEGLTERIEQVKSEITRLQMLAVEDKIPIVEAEYRALLSEVWEDAILDVTEAERLELARLKLGIRPEQARKIENNIRIALAHESFYKIPSRYFETNALTDEEWKDTALYLANAIRLNFEATFDLSIQYFLQKFSELGDIVSFVVNQNLESLLSDILRQCNVWKDKEEYHLFKDFMEKLQAEIIQRLQPSHDKEKDTFDVDSSRLATYQPIRPVPPHIDVTGAPPVTQYKGTRKDK